MVEPITDLDSARISAKVQRVHEAAGAEVEILVAGKYVPLERMEILAEAGISLIGENRQQDLEAKRERWGELFEWDFIGNLQSRKVKSILPIVRLIHSVGTDSVLEQLGKHADPSTEILIQVNVAGEQGKGGVEPAALGEFIERCPVGVAGLATMPPGGLRPGALAAALRPARRARGRARAGATLDGHQPGLAGRRVRGRDHDQARIRSAALTPAGTSADSRHNQNKGKSRSEAKERD